MKSGDKVRIKTKGGEKAKGVITDVRFEAEILAFQSGQQVAGRTTCTLTIELEGPPR